MAWADPRESAQAIIIARIVVRPLAGGSLGIRLFPLMLFCVVSAEIRSLH
jgi:hypothetical protein